MKRPAGAALWTLFLALFLALIFGMIGGNELRAAEGDPAILDLQIVEGDGGAYQVGSRATRGVTVLVSDETGRPVSGATVSFTLPGDGPSGVFASGGRTEIVLTRADGRAAVWGMQWNRLAGAFEIRITAAKGHARAGILCPTYLSDSPVANTSSTSAAVRANEAAARSKLERKKPRATASSSAQTGTPPDRENSGQVARSPNASAQPVVTPGATADELSARADESSNADPDGRLPRPLARGSDAGSQAPRRSRIWSNKWVWITFAAAGAAVAGASAVAHGSGGPAPAAAAATSTAGVQIGSPTISLGRP